MSGSRISTGPGRSPSATAPGRSLIGPELGFGTVVGDAHDETVLLVKCAWGGKSLAIDFRPPSAGRPAIRSARSSTAAIAADPTMVGKYYRETIARVKAVCAAVKAGRLNSAAAGRVDHVLAGFAWHQGWNDRVNDPFNDEYASNLAALIRDVRRDLGAPRLPVRDRRNRHDRPRPRRIAGPSRLMQAQAAVAAGPEFKGTVAFVPTRAFWRPAAASPADQGYHWNRNAETYWLIGTGLGQAMLAIER